jgi:hypothetical protein
LTFSNQINAINFSVERQKIYVLQNKDKITADYVVEVAPLNAGPYLRGGVYGFKPPPPEILEKNFLAHENLQYF